MVNIIHLFSSKKLIQDFKKKSITQKDTMKYLIVVLLWSLLASFCFEYPQEYISGEVVQSELSSKAYFIRLGVLLLIHIFGVYICFWENSRGDGENFIERFICLSVPIGIKILFFILILSVSHVLLEELIKKEIYSYVFEGGAYEFFFDIILKIIFYFYMVTAFGEISEGQNPVSADVIN
ncbi:MAG: hypothetical protein ACQESJ_08390 [Bacteroidota bacterium]